MGLGSRRVLSLHFIPSVVRLSSTRLSVTFHRVFGVGRNLALGILPLDGVVRRTHRALDL